MYACARLGPKYLPYLLYLCHLSKTFSPSKPQFRDSNSTHCMVIGAEVIQGSACTVSSRILGGKPVLKDVNCCYCSNKRARTLSVGPEQSGKISQKRQLAVKVMLKKMTVEVSWEQSTLSKWTEQHPLAHGSIVRSHGLFQKSTTHYCWSIKKFTGDKPGIGSQGPDPEEDILSLYSVPVIF